MNDSKVVTDTPSISINSVWVNHAYIGMDECDASQEAVGTLIHTMSHGCIIKVSETAARHALLDEMATWTGPISPAWADVAKRGGGLK